MITVADVREGVKSVLGTCSEAQFYSKLNESIEELANLGNWDPLVVSLDICTDGCEITLPDDIEVPLAVNVGGRPADFRNKWFQYHLNGPGTDCCQQACSRSWEDLGDFPTFRNPIKASQIAVYPEVPEAAGANLRVYGYDGNEKWIMTLDSNGVMQDGFDAPIIYGVGSGMTVSQTVKRITRLEKPVTNGFIRVVALDPGASTGGTLLGLIRPNFTNPLFRRIKVSGGGIHLLTNSTQPCKTWVRMKARKKTFIVSSPTDLIPLHSVTAIKMMVMATAKYEKDLINEYKEYLNTARESLQREQKTRSGPNQIKIQFQNKAYAGRPGDNLI